MGRAKVGCVGGWGGAFPSRELFPNPSGEIVRRIVSRKKNYVHLRYEIKESARPLEPAGGSLGEVSLEIKTVSHKLAF